MNLLVIIPARGGSKGLPGKNIKKLGGLPLVAYTIDAARAVAPDDMICVSTDSPEIKAVVEDYGLKVPFLRPAELATDGAGTYEVLLHALDYYEKQGRQIDAVVLMQPTSPFRNGSHVREALAMYSPEIDMVVSVKPTDANPYFNCFEEDEQGYLHISKGDGLFARRQDCPEAYQYNGAIYVINPSTLRRMPLGKFPRRVKYVMDDLHSIDIDTPLDFAVAEAIISQGLIDFQTTQPTDA